MLKLVCCFYLKASIRSNYAKNFNFIVVYKIDYYRCKIEVF